MTLALRAVTAAVLLFLLAPMVVVVAMSFSPTEALVFPPRGLSLRWYAEFAASDRWTSATRNSLIVAGCTTAVATLLGTLAALGLHLGTFRGRATIAAMLSLPIVTPYIVTAAAMFFAFSVVGLTGTLVGLVLAHTVVAVPFVVLSVAAALRGFDMNLLLAAASLGARRGTAFRRVLVPGIWPGIAAGAVFAFATSLDEFVITLFMAGPGQFTLPRQMYAAVRDFVSPTILAAATVLFLGSTLFLLASEALRWRAERRRGTGR